MIIGVLVVELVSVVAVVAVVGVVVGVAAAGAAAVFTFTAGVVFTFAPPVAGFAAPVAGVVGVANRFCPALARAEGVMLRASSVTAAHVHAASRAALGKKGRRRVGLLCL